MKQVIYQIYWQAITDELNENNPLYSTCFVVTGFNFSTFLQVIFKLLYKQSYTVKMGCNSNTAKGVPTRGRNLRFWVVETTPCAVFPNTFSEV